MGRLACWRLCKSFGGVDALDELSIQFPERGVVAIVGPNGAGKTTLLNVITGLVDPDRGSIFLGEREVTGTPPHRMVRLGIVRGFQDLRLLENQSVFDNLALAFAGQSGEQLRRAVAGSGIGREEERKRREAKEILKYVGLKCDLDTPARMLSYGQQKLLSLARCYATDARILLLDEPVAGLHPEMIVRIAKILREMEKEGRLVIFVEHDLATVRSGADLVFVIAEGRLIAEGEPHETLGKDEVYRAYVG